MDESETIQAGLIHLNNILTEAFEEGFHTRLAQEEMT